MIQSLSNFKNYILQEINAKYELCSLCEEEGKDKKPTTLHMWFALCKRDDHSDAFLPKNRIRIYSIIS